MSNVTLELNNNQALHLWGMMASYIHDTTNELIAQGIFKKDGTLNKLRKNFSDVTQERLDNLALSQLLLKELEESVDFSELES